MQDIPDLLEGLKRSSTILKAFMKTIPGDMIYRRRGEGVWTIAEHVDHLANVQPMLLQRLERFVTEDCPEFSPYIPDNNERIAPAIMETADALKQFDRYRAQQVLFLEDADRAIWLKKGVHPEYDDYSMYILGRHILMHDFWHMYRIEELWLTKDAYLTVIT